MNGEIIEEPEEQIPQEYLNIVIPRRSLPINMRHITALDIIGIMKSISPIIVMPQQKSSVQRGREGENDINIMIQGFERMRPGTHSGDLIIWKHHYPNLRILVEVKNYTYRVPYEQWVKFENDIEGNYNGGIFVTTQAVSGVEETVFSNKIIVRDFNEVAINLACETLWQRLYERLRLGLMSEDKMLHHCEDMMSVKDDLHRLRHDTEAIQRSTALINTRVTKNMDGIMQRLDQAVNRIAMDISVTDTTYSTRRVIIPPMDCSLTKTGLPLLVQLLESLAGPGTEIVMIQKQTKCTYVIADKKITIHFLKSKINVSFIPTTMDFTDLTNLSYDDGVVIIHITAKNYNDENVYATIRKLF